MMRFNVGGRYLDLYADTSLQYVRKNMLFAFDDIQLDRTAEFDVPATPNNNALFELANDPARVGMQTRVKIAAQMQAGAVAIDGYLHVSKCDAHSYSCIFTFGELQKLKAIKDAGAIADFVSNDSVTVGGQYHFAYNTDPSVLFDNIAYHDGHVTPADIEGFGYEAGYFPLPSWSVVEVLKAGLNRLGVALDYTDAPTLPNIRITVAKPIKRGDTQIVVLNVRDGEITEWNGNYMQRGLSVVWYERGHGWQSWNMPTFYVVHDMKLTITSGFASELTYQLVNFTGAYEYEVITKDLRAGSEIELKRGMRIAVITNSMLPSDGEEGLAPSLDTYRISGTTTGAGGVAVRQETIYLQDNLPQITLVELLKTAAALTGTLLYFNNDTIYLQKPQFERYEYGDRLLVVGDLRRTFADYAQRNKVIFVDNKTGEDAQPIIYAIPNVNIDEEKELLNTGISLGGVIDIPNTNGYGGEDGDVLVEDLIAEYDSEAQAYKITYPAEYGTAVYMGDNFFCMPIPDNTSEVIQTLCDISTSLTAKVLLSFSQFVSLDEHALLNIRGQLYVWTGGQWSDGVASLSLSKYTL